MKSFNDMERVRKELRKRQRETNCAFEKIKNNQKRRIRERHFDKLLSASQSALTGLLSNGVGVVKGDGQDGPCINDSDLCEEWGVVAQAIDVAMELLCQLNLEPITDDEWAQYERELKAIEARYHPEKDTNQN